MKTAVLFPGIGYHCDKPLLYYAGRLARQNGSEEIVRVSYTYNGGNIRGNARAMKDAFDTLYAQAAEQLDKVPWERYEDILFISKSIGTGVAAAYAARHQLNVRHILYTPLKETYAFCPERGIAFIGTDDPWSDTALVGSLSREAGIPITIIRGGNHSLETGDVSRDLEVLRQVMEETKSFM